MLSNEIREILALEDRHHSRLWERLIRKLRRSAGPEDAEDALQSAFLRLERYRCNTAIADEEAFLIHTARNIAIDNHRRRAARGETAIDIQFDELVDPAPLQDEIVEQRRRLVEVRRRIDALPPRTRQVFEMHRLDNLKYREIAERLGITQSAVEKHIARAMLALSRPSGQR